MAVTVTDSPSTTKLIALADLKPILGITDSANDTLLGNTIQRGSDAIPQFCNRVFAQRTVVKTLPGTGGQLLKLKFSLIVTLTSIAFDGDTVDSDTYALTEPDAGMGFCEGGWFYTGHAYDYTATYSHGSNLPDMMGTDTRPHDIQPAALELCKGMWLAHQRDPSVTLESVPDVYTVQYGQGKNGASIRGDSAERVGAAVAVLSGVQAMMAARVQGVDRRGRGHDHRHAGHARPLQHGDAATHAFGAALYDYGPYAAVADPGARRLGPAGRLGSAARRGGPRLMPRPNNQVVIGGKTYQVVLVNTRSPFHEAAIYLLHVRGGNGKKLFSKHQAVLGRTAWYDVRRLIS